MVNLQPSLSTVSAMQIVSPYFSSLPCQLSHYPSFPVLKG